MKQDLRRRRFFSKFALATLHPVARATLVLFALLQIVAPSWHVCALGGPSCHSEHEPAVEVWKPKCGGGPLCPCVQPKGTLYSPTGQWFSAPIDNAFHGVCLARLLMGMPSSATAPFDFTVLFSQRIRFAPTHFHCPTVATLPQPPSRGPPLLLV